MEFMRTKLKNNHLLLGYTLSVLAGVLWGISGNFGDVLFDEYQLNVEFLVLWREIITGIILLTFLLFKKREIFSIWKQSTKDSLLLVLYAIFGVIGVQYFFFLTIRYANAATATVIQYLAPVFIVIFGAVIVKHKPNFSQLVAVLLAFFGIFLFATGGSFHTLNFSVKALIYGLISCIGLVYYLVGPTKLVNKYGTMMIVGWGMLLGGIIMCLYTLIILPARFQSGVSWDLRSIFLFGFLIIFGTLLPFTFCQKSIQLIGAEKAGILSCTEPLTSVLVAIVWLGQSFKSSDFIGILSIIVAVTLISVIDLHNANSSKNSN